MAFASGSKNHDLRAGAKSTTIPKMMRAVMSGKIVKEDRPRGRSQKRSAGKARPVGAQLRRVEREGRWAVVVSGSP